MERKIKNSQVREDEKKRIIDASIQLISNKSYSEFSMRSLAKELNMSATNIYQYFKNRDEILVNVLLEIFDVFIAERKMAYDAADNPIDRAQNISWAMFYFSISNFSYYDIFYGRRILPKFDEYKNDDVAELMKRLEEKQIEMYRLWETILMELYPGREPIVYKLIEHEIGSRLHGAIRFYHYKPYSALFENKHRLITFTIEQIVSDLKDPHRWDNL